MNRKLNNFDIFFSFNLINSFYFQFYLFIVKKLEKLMDLNYFGKLERWVIMKSKNKNDRNDSFYIFED